MWSNTRLSGRENAKLSIGVCVRADGEEVTDESELAEYYTTIADQLLISGQPDAAY